MDLADVMRLNYPLQNQLGYEFVEAASKGCSPRAVAAYVDALILAPRTLAPS